MVTIAGVSRANVNTRKLYRTSVNVPSHTQPGVVAPPPEAMWFLFFPRHTEGPTQHCFQHKTKKQV